ncbi:MAG TPA: hypothetical protein DDY78_20875 [Planctomycetales bacterium]|jgi:hypothetical protein|nr:hypothetical protein [Planctomycetales bacterium]
MTLEETLLQKLADWRFDNGRQTLTVAHPETGWSAAVVADFADRVGCQLWELNLNRPETAPSGDLKSRAERLAGRATGLMEPLRLIEVDVQGDAALLRSAAPQKRGDDLFYYEVLLRSAGAGVRRYQSSAKGARQQVAFPLTHEATAKLAADLTADA